MFAVHVIHLFGNNEALFWIEAELLLYLFAVVFLQSIAVDATSSLKLGAEANRGGKLDDRRLVFDLLGLCDCCLYSFEVSVTLLDPLRMPAIGFKTLHDVLGKRNFGVSICIADQYELDVSRK